MHLLVALCRWCHDQTDAPYERGRLVVTALGGGQFTFEVVQQAARGTSPAPVPIFASRAAAPMSARVWMPFTTSLESSQPRSRLSVLALAFESYDALAVTFVERDRANASLAFEHGPAAI